MRKKYTTLSIVTLCGLLSTGLLQAQSTLVVNNSYPGRFLPITSVTYEINGNTIVQNASTFGNNQKSQPVYVTNVSTATRNLDVFNFSGAQLRDANGVLGQSSIMTSDSGIGIANHTGITGVAAGKSAFDAALIGSTQNNNILNYIYYDGSNTTPAAAFDFDLLFYRSFLPTDAFLIQERDGNTFFAVTPLGANGQPIAGANKLVIGGNTDANPESGGSSHTRYNWGTGYALSNYQSSQEMDFTVVEASTFFSGTSVNPLDQVVYGFRIDNNGNADVKFFGLSDDSFDNNPINPLLVPEVSSSLMTMSGILLLATRRRRQV